MHFKILSINPASRIFWARRLAANSQRRSQRAARGVSLPPELKQIQSVLVARVGEIKAVGKLIGKLRRPLQAKGENVVIPESWGLQFLDDLKPLGLFDEIAGVSMRGVPPVIILKILELLLIAKEKRVVAIHLNAPSSFAEDFRLLQLATKGQIWFRKKSHPTVRRGQREYKYLLQSMQKFSRGSFVPENITEVWSDQRNRLEIRFDFDGHRRLVTAQRGQIPFGQAPFDPTVITRLNGYLQGLWRFEVIDIPEFDWAVFFITPEAKASLHQKRNWPWGQTRV